MATEPNTPDPRLDWLEAWYECFALLCDTFTHSRPSDRASEIYAERLADIPADELRATVEQCIATCRFFPTIADLREAAGLVGADREPTPIEAWEEVRQAIQAAIFQRPFVWRNAAAERVARAMDLYQLRASKNSSADRAHFLQAYREAVERDRRRASVVPAARAALLPRPEADALPVADSEPSSGMTSAKCSRCDRWGVVAREQARPDFVCPPCRGEPAPPPDFLTRRAPGDGGAA